MPSKAEIQARMALDTNPFTGGLKKSDKAAKKTGDSIMKSLGPVAGALGLGAIASKAMNAAHEIKILSGIANASSEDFQKQAFAAKSVNVETEKLADIYKDTQDKVGDFLKTGGGPLKDFFEQIAPQVGVTADQFRDLSGPDALQLYYDSVAKANVSQSEMVFYMEAIASDATNLIPLLKDGGAEFERMGNKAQIMGEKAVKALSDAKVNLESAEKNLTVAAGNTIGWMNDLTEVSTLMVLSAVEGRNIFAELGEAEAEAEFYAEQRAKTAARQAKSEAEAATQLMWYNEQVRKYTEYQKAAAQAAVDRAEAERKLAAEFKKDVSAYVNNAELEAIKLRADGELAAAEAMDKRVEKMRQAVIFSNKYNITLGEAAKLVQKLAEQETARATSDDGSGAGGTASPAEASTPAEVVDNKLRGKIRTGKIGDRAGPSFRQREIAAGLYNTTLGRDGRAMDGLPPIAATAPSAKDRAADKPADTAVEIKGEALSLLRSTNAELTDATPAKEA